MARRRIAYNELKFAELVLYIAGKCENHAHFGRTKLNKILFYADFLSYRTHGQAITGAEYRKLQFGPAATRLQHVEDHLIRTGAAVRRERMSGAWPEKRVVPTRPYRAGLLSATDIETVDSVIDALKDDRAVDVSEISHQLPAWELADMKEPIPYFTVYLAQESGPLSESDMKWARGVAANYAN